VTIRLVIGLMWLLHLLPLAALARVGEALGMLFYWFGHERRRVCLLNLERCLPELAQPERVALAKSHFRALGRSLLERGILWWAPRDRILRLVRLSGIEHLRALSGTPVIILAPHFVGLDAGVTRLTCEIDMVGIFARQKSEALNRLLLAGRLRFGHGRAYSRQDGVRGPLAGLREGLPFYYLPDQDYGPRDAIFVPFFGVPAATITGLSRMARVARARVVPCVTTMLPGGGGYEVKCYPPWENFPTDDVAADTRRMNAFIEDRVREMPAQYLWTHKRFKTRPPGEPRWY
jgi:Kdo2-lipid IVA lauroyltransferase/acyltransferase